MLADDGYLLHADLLRLIPAAADAASVRGRERAHLLRLTPQAVAAPAPERAALLNVVQALQLMPPTIGDPRMPYRARWAHTAPRVEHAALGRAHRLGQRGVRGQGPARVGRRRRDDPAVGPGDRARAGGADRPHRTGEQHLRGPRHARLGRQRRHRARRNPATGRRQKLLRAHTGPVTTVCAIKGLVASAGGNVVRLWDPGTGREVATLTGHTDRVKAVCPVRLRGRDLLVTASKDLTVRLWQPETGVQETILEEDAAWITTLRSVTVDGRSLLAASTIYGTVRPGNR